MITCYIRYIVDPDKLVEFEHYGKLWIPLVEKFGGKHHGYFLPSEGASNVALAMFNFLTLLNTRIIGINRSRIQTARVHLNMLERQNVLLTMSAISFAQYFNRSKATPNNTNAVGRGRASTLMRGVMCI